MLTVEELTTVLTTIEAILNSRPLCRVKTGDDYEPLTPGHLLIGSSLLESGLDQLQCSFSQRFSLMRTIINSFWHRFVNSYVGQLQGRTKWREKRTNLSEGDLVLLRDPNSSPLLWPTEIVEECFLDASGQVRIVTVRTKQGTYRRSVQSIVPLPTEIRSTDPLDQGGEPV